MSEHKPLKVGMPALTQAICETLGIEPWKVRRVEMLFTPSNIAEVRVEMFVGYEGTDTDMAAVYKTKTYHFREVGE